MSPPFCFSSRHHICHKIVSAFARGCGGKIVYEGQPNEFVVSYGLKRGCDEVYKQSSQYLYIDKGYFKPSNHPHDFSGYYRVCYNSLIHSGVGNHSWDRFESFGYKLKPWKKDGTHIIFCPILSVPAKFYGINIDEWTRTTYLKIKEYTDRPIIVSTKTNGVNAKEWFKKAHCLITFNSNIMIDAVIAGVPIICLSSDRPIGSIEKIEQPVYYREWLKNLAANQWNLKEFESEKCWRELNDRTTINQ